MMLFVNGVLSVLFWHWASKAFENKMDKIGWLYIFFSAWNAAALAAALV